MSALERVLVVPWNDRYSVDDVHYISDGLQSAIYAYLTRSTPV
jgi:hypothetical protein